MSKKIKVGDRIALKKEIGLGTKEGYTGEVVEIDEDDSYIIEFDQKIEGWTYNKSSREGQYLFVNYKDMEKIESEKDGFFAN